METTWKKSDRSLTAEVFICLKKVAFALVSAFGSTYTSEYISPHRRAALQRCGQTPAHLEACEKL